MATARTGRKTTAKKAAKKATKKTAAKKATARRVATKRPAARKVAKKAAPRKATKKAASKKVSARKAAKKAVARRAPAKRAAKKAAPKSAARKVVKKTAAKKPAAKKASTRRTPRKTTPRGRQTMLTPVTESFGAEEEDAGRMNEPGAASATAPKWTHEASDESEEEESEHSATITPEQALAKTRELLEAKHERERQAPPWQQLDQRHGQVPKPGFQSDSAAAKAEELHSGETRMNAIQGSISSQDRHHQGKRDNR